MSSDAYEGNESNSMDPIGFDDAEAVVTTEYFRLRNLWFPANQQAEPTNINVVRVNTGEPSISWGYDHPTRTQRMVIDEGDLQVSNFYDFGAASPPHDIYVDCDALITAWRVYLAHELCHEYQWVVLGDHADDWGIAKYADPTAKHWNGFGHTPAFYTAIRAFALQFGLDPDYIVSKW